MTTAQEKTMQTPTLIQATGHVLGHIAPDTAARWAVGLATWPRFRHGQNSSPDLTPGVQVTFRYGLRALRWGVQGPIVLTLHGWEGHPNQYRALGHALAERGFQLYALFGPGHAPGERTRAHPGLFRDALLEAAAELKSVHTVIGHSMGAGAMAMALAEGLAADRAISIAGPNGYGDVLDRIGRGLHLTDQSRNRFKRRMEQRTGLPLANTVAAELLPHIDIPLLIVHDRNDSIVPFIEAEQIAAQAPNAQMLATRELGHSRLMADASVIETMSRFILD